MSCTPLHISTFRSPIQTNRATQPRPTSRHVSPRMSLTQPPPPPPQNPDPITAVTRLLWGKSLPPQLLISTFRSESSPGLSHDTALHLYVGLPCPWAHRTLIVRSLKGLEDTVPVSIASPGIDGSWEFLDTPVRVGDGPNPGPDTANGCKTLREVYKLRRGGYDGRSTVQMLWDAERKEVVCNESYDIIELFNSGLNRSAGNPDLDLSPPSLKTRIDEWNQIIYPRVNNRV
ncbi:hypothetical protein RJ639_012400 [Escallonia herrerae]|uniref:GST N-terminal domain-containing protein n=1 Tax=Escallonia herrerae TaxID=1293975 RepID=A0AA88VM67_9ASTE|nr:hypothetical protein RJ639_012400 [Escallonia herrerae]